MMHPALWLSMAALLGRFVLATLVILVLLGALLWQQYRTNRRQKRDGDAYLARQKALGPDAMGRDWSPHVEPQDWPERPRRAG